MKTECLLLFRQCSGHLCFSQNKCTVRWSLWISFGFNTRDKIATHGIEKEMFNDAKRLILSREKKSFQCHCSALRWQKMASSGQKQERKNYWIVWLSIHSSFSLWILISLCLKMIIYSFQSQNINVNINIIRYRLNYNFNSTLFFFFIYLLFLYMLRYTEIWGSNHFWT